MDDNINSVSKSGIGVAYGLAAFATWGLVPIYFKAVASVPPVEVLAHRIIWSVALLILVIQFSGRWSSVRKSLQLKQSRLILAVTTILIAGNWLVFIWAVATDKVLQASLGYFINPLVSVFLGMLFLRERLSRWGKLSVFLALVGVGVQIVKGTGLPWPALVLAFSFGFYGLLRKIVKADAVIGLAVETALLGPIALAYLIILGINDTGQFGTVSWQMTTLLVCAGFVTALPLIWFTKAARRLDLSTIGFMQYIAPSLHFLLAVAVYGELFTFVHGVTFGFIWVALIIFSIDTARNRRQQYI